MDVVNVRYLKVDTQPSICSHWGKIPLEGLQHKKKKSELVEDSR